MQDNGSCTGYERNGDHMTTNEIMANLEAMSKSIEDNLKALEPYREALNDSPESLRPWAVLTTRIDDLKCFKSWLDDLQKKHWEQEAQLEDATMFLHMIK